MPPRNRVLLLNSSIIQTMGTLLCLLKFQKKSEIQFFKSEMLAATVN